jgi:hypothetical protein
MRSASILSAITFSLALMISSCSIPTTIETAPFNYLRDLNGIKNFPADTPICVMKGGLINGMDFDHFTTYTRDPYGHPVTKYICDVPIQYPAKVDKRPILGPISDHIADAYFQSKLKYFYKNNIIIGTIKKDTKFHYVKVVSGDFVAFIIQIDSGPHKGTYAILHVAPQSL